MIIRLIRWLRGYVDFCAYGKFPERFINLTVKYGINLWNAHPAPDGMCGTMPVYDYKNIRRLCRKAKIRTKITRRRGLPFFIKRYKPRIGILIGALLGAIILFVLSKFIWSINITPTENLGRTQILEILEENGVQTGSYIPSIDVAGIKRSILLDTEEIGWMSINIKGSTAEINIKEKTPKPQTADSTTPCNIKARCDGVITDIKASKGVTQVLKGSGVTQGELLVSGIVETKLNTIEYVHASAEIYADVISEKEIKIPASVNYYSLTENKTNRYICKFLNFEFPCSLSFDAFENQVTSYNRESLYLNDTVLPLQIITQQQTEITKNEAAYTDEELRRIALNRAILYEAFSKKESKVVSRKLIVSKHGDEATAHIDYIFNENIAVTSDFSVTD